MGLTNLTDAGSESFQTHSEADAGHTASAWLYVGMLAASVAVLLPWALSGISIKDAIDVPWILLVLMFAATEYHDLSVHDGVKRVGLTSCDAILMPLVAGYPAGISVLGVVVAMAIVRTLRWRGGPLKWLYNVSSYGLSAAMAAGVYSIWPSSWFGNLGGLIGAAVAAGCFAVLTHLSTSIVISLAQGGSILDFTRNVGSLTVLNVAANIAIGMLFVASFAAATVSVVVFPFALIGLYIGIRAAARRAFERDRIEKLYEATHALVEPDTATAITAFLSAVCKATYAEEAILVSGSRGGPLWSKARSDDPIAAMEPLPVSHPFASLPDVAARLGPLAFSEDDRPPQMRSFGARNGMIAPVGSEPQAALAVFGRTAPDEWGEEELRLLVALAQELRLALQSHRLLLEVTEERERLRRIFEGSREGIALLDESGVVLACNPSLEFLFGADDQELTGALWRDAIDLKAANGVPIHLQDVLTSGEELEAQITKFDKPRWVTLTAAPVEVETGAGWVVLVRDITHQREVEMAKSDFLATISHELRTPLTSIKGSIQVLGRDDLDRAPGSREQMLRIVRRGADRLERLVLNLLYVSQLDASGSAHLFIGQVDLRQVLEEACADLLNGKDADIHFPTEPVFVNGDRERLVHTIEHLLENATTHGQGRVTVDVRIDKDAHILVKDEGPGIPLEEREHIFDRFVRLGDVTTRNVQGAGVGLYIARASVRAMGGDVWVEDPPDRPGSVFHVRLPLITAEARRGDSRLATGDHPARSTQRSIARP